MADPVSVLIVAGSAAAALGVLGWFVLGGRRPVIKARVEPEELRYLCEGAHSVLCAYIGGKPEWQGQLLQLWKEQPSLDADSVGSDFLRRADIQYALASHLCWGEIEQPQVVAIPVDTVRRIDAQVLSARPHRERQQRLSLDVAPAHTGRVLALRQRNLFEAAPCGLPVQPAALVVELRLGCGLREMEGLPSRHAMAAQVRSGSPWPAADAATWEPLALFSRSRPQLVAACRDRLTRNSAESDGARLFLDGRPVQGLAGSPFRTQEELGAAMGAVLAKRRGLLTSVLRLQCFAAGECERLAERMLQDLELRCGAEAVAVLHSTASVKVAIRSASRAWAGDAGTRAHEREGRRLLAAPVWSAQEREAAQRWLALFLLGRAAFEARVLFSFVRLPGPGQDGGAGSDLVEARRCLRAARYRPLDEAASDLPDSAGIWACVTLAGLDPPGPSEVVASASELESCASRYRELLAATAKAA